MINSSDPPRTSEMRRDRLLILALVVVLIGGLVTSRLVLERHTPLASPSAVLAADIGRIAPTGLFTSTTGHPEHLAWYVRKGPTMVWFVVAGCASCAVSIPSVAQHLRLLATDHVHVLVLDLFGDLGSGLTGRAELVDFGKASSGSSYESPTWTWGLASKSLSYAYDPSGTPDEYFLVAPNGRVVLQNRVPLNTMSQLLRAAGRLSLSR